MLIIGWISIFIVSLVILVKSSDWLVESAEKIGKAIHLSPFIIGVTIIGIGTSLPELGSSLAAVFQGHTEIVMANVVGSNIANILLVIGFSAIVGGTLVVKKSLIDLDAPLLGGTTALLIFMMLDQKITRGEAILLLIGFVAYISYAIFYKPIKEEPEETLPSRIERRRTEAEKKMPLSQPTKLSFKVFLYLILGTVGLVLGAKYTVASIIGISQEAHIATSLISITALAIGTSLPELTVSTISALKKKYEIAIGNVFGSNVFNALLVTSVPALIKPLVVDNLTLYIGVPFLAVATLLFILSGISRRIHNWEGFFYLLLYTLFVAKLANLF